MKIFEIPECYVDILAEFHVLEHALELGCECGPALGLELGEHGLLAVDGSTLPHQETLGQVFLVEGLENILAVDKAKDDHDLVQDSLHLLLGGLFVARPQLGVDVLGNELGGLVLSLVDERLEGLLHADDERFVPLETLVHNQVKFVLEGEKKAVVRSSLFSNSLNRGKRSDILTRLLVGWLEKFKGGMKSSRKTFV